MSAKEQNFDVLAGELVQAVGSDRRRASLTEESVRNIKAIQHGCPQDFDALARRLEEAISAKVRRHEAVNKFELLRESELWSGSYGELVEKTGHSPFFEYPDPGSARD